MADKEIDFLVKEAKARAKEMGIVKGSPIDSFSPHTAADPKEEVEKYRDIFGDFSEIDSTPALKIVPFHVVPLQNAKVREMTANDKKEFIWLHEYVECYLHSNIALYEAGTFSDLAFCYNPTIWSNLEFWNIPHSKKISVPRHIILWINKTCTPCELTCRDLSRQEVDSKLYTEGMCESGRYYLKKSKRPQYYFTSTAHALPSMCA